MAKGLIMKFEQMDVWKKSSRLACEIYKNNVLPIVPNHISLSTLK